MKDGIDGKAIAFRKALNSTKGLFLPIDEVCRCRIAIVLASVGTLIILKIVDPLIGSRVSEVDELSGFHILERVSSLTVRKGVSLMPALTLGLLTHFFFFL